MGFLPARGQASSFPARDVREGCVVTGRLNDTSLSCWLSLTKTTTSPLVHHDDRRPVPIDDIQIWIAHDRSILYVFF
jgi:hypothetical protein